MSAETLLARLDGVRSSGKGWSAKCPAHEDRGPSLAVSEGTEGRVLIHCFAGCNALDVLHAIGLTLADLFPERIAANDTPEDLRRIRRAARESQWGAALEVLQFEARIVAICARELLVGKSLDEADHARLAVAQRRIEDAETVLTDRPERRHREAMQAMKKRFSASTQ